MSELPEVFAMIGPPAIRTLAAFVADRTNDIYSRNAAAEGLTKIAQAQRNLPAGVKPDLNSPAAQAALQQLRAQAGTAGIQDVFTLVMIGTVVLLLVALALPGRAAQAERHTAPAETAPARSLAME